MRFHLVLCLVWLGVNGEKKINLEDIERDNLRAEGLSKSGNSRVEETKYLTKEIGQQYQNQYRGHPAGPPVTFVTPSPQNAPSESYNVQFNKYAKEQVYQPQNNVLPEQVLPPRYYNEYQQQPQRGIAPNVYESQQLAYQPEVNVGNRLQAVQQKIVTAKYTKSPNKDTIYVNIPMMHLLTYYPNLVNSKGGEFLLPQLSAASTEHISIPVYTSALSQKPIVPGKPTYQVQYAPKHNAAPASFSTKVTKGAAYTPVTSKKFTSSQLGNAQSYSPSDQTFAQGRQLLYTQAYVSPSPSSSSSSSQPQYVPQLVYAQPTTTVYMHAAPIYNPFYTRAPTYVQDNSLQANVNYAIPSEQLDATVADELPDQVLAHQQPAPQNYVKDSDEPNADLTPPQVPAQDFKSGPQTVIQVSQEEEAVPEQNQVGLSEPRSLLDSYVPSKLIAAQDSVRYQERPIKLESGFLPSKENFLHKKRKSE